MANPIKPKRSYTANAIPLSSDLEIDELAINWTDGKIFAKTPAGEIISWSLSSGGQSGGGSGGETPVITITTQPADQTLEQSGGGFVATLTVAATVSGGGTLSYQWQAAESETGPWSDLMPEATTNGNPDYTGQQSALLGVDYLNRPSATGWYRVVVSAVGAQSVTSNAASLAPPPTANAPTSLAATAGNAQLALSWTAPTYAGTSAITGYRVEYTPSGGAAQTVDTGSTSTSYTLTGLTNGTSYSVQVAAINAAGTGVYSQAATGTPVGTALTPLSGLTNNGTVSGSGTADSPLVWEGSIKWAGVSGSYEGAASAFTVQTSGTLYINVTLQGRSCGDSDQQSLWYKNGVYAGLNGYCRTSYTGSFAVVAGDAISVRYEAYYDQALNGFSAYVA